MTYMHYTEGSFTVREEEDDMILDYDSSEQMVDQIRLQAFEFLSITEDNDQQKLDSLFGLGLPTPEHALEDQKMTTIRWMLEKQYIHEQVVSVYIRNYNGVNIQKAKDAQTKYGLPDSFARFGPYNSTGLVTDNKMYFWTVSSQYNWTLDMYGIQYG